LSGQSSVTASIVDALP